MSRPTRVLVTGAAGQVGLDLVAVLGAELPPGGDSSFQPDRRRVEAGEFDVVACTRRDLDVTDREAVLHVVGATRPDVIVHLAAYTAVDRAELDSPACYAINADGTGYLSAAAASRGAHLVAVSTDYVFDGEKGSAYREDDATNPLNVYGASKLAGELLCTDEDTVVRTSWVMGVRGKNVLHTIAERAASGQNVRFVDDQIGTVTLAADLARALVTLVRSRPGGRWHVANSGTTTWFNVAHFAGDVLGRGDDFATAIPSDQLSPAPLARRPRRSDLSTQRWQGAQWDALPEWTDGVRRLLSDRSSLGEPEPQ